MMGCQHGAKNTLDLNYLYLAEKRGVQVMAETRVVDVKPLGDEADGSAGYEVTTVCSTAFRESVDASDSPAVPWSSRRRRWEAWSFFSI